MNDARWEDAHRLEAWAGETRVNLIRAAALAGFYAYHLLNVYVLTEDASLRHGYHLKVTCVVLAWALAVVALHVCLTRRYMPPVLKYAATFWDLALVTALLLADKSAGPHSALLFLYFLVLAASPLRLSLRLVTVTTLGAMATAALMMGCYVFVLVGSTEYYAAGSPWRVGRAGEIVYLLGLGTAGLLAGQVVRQARRLVRGYPVTARDEKEAA